MRCPRNAPRCDGPDGTRPKCAVCSEDKIKALILDLGKVVNERDAALLQNGELKELCRKSFVLIRSCVTSSNLQTPTECIVTATLLDSLLQAMQGVTEKPVEGPPKESTCSDCGCKLIRQVCPACG